MSNASPDTATVQALRSDVALQLARLVQRLGVSQVVAAKQLGLPQPTLSKIINGRVSDLSLELLIRTAARAGLPITLQTGRVPQEAGAFVSGAHLRTSRTSRSRLGEEARESMIQSTSRLTPTERLQAFLEHNQLLGALHQAGRAAGTQRKRAALRTP
ncbi:MAG TPA: XRE family transcriptional regulator [Steroidobacteraceae bacterium]|nr:XRE family transcriptional regulator [Steroidobacteraceae bacterium]